MDQKKGSLDSRGGRRGGYGSGHVVVGLGIGVGAMIICSGLHHYKLTLYVLCRIERKKERERLYTTLYVLCRIERRAELKEGRKREKRYKEREREREREKGEVWDWGVGTRN